MTTPTSTSAAQTFTGTSSATASDAERKIWGVIIASSAGTVIEWYDFYIFGSLAAVLSGVFYPETNATISLLKWLATFAVGFAVRPFGALLFGRIGDLVGRKYAFMITMTLMGLGTFLIGLLPSYASAGIAAPAILIVLRLIQGLAWGANMEGPGTIRPG